MVTEDNHGWKGTYTNGAPALGIDFGAPNGTMDCKWFAENDPGCSGVWLDALRVPAAALDAAILQDVLVANGHHSQLIPHEWELARPASTCPLSASGTFAMAVESCIDVDGADCGIPLGVLPVQRCRVGGERGFSSEAHDS